MENLIEEFRAVKGYEGIYEISNFGRVKMLPVIKLNMGKYPFITKEKITKGSFDNKGYLTFGLSKNGIRIKRKIHQLVAMAFLNHSPDGTTKICVDHINNKDRANNRVDNLRLISNRENCTKDKSSKYSRYKGVHYNKNKDTWLGQVTFKNKRYSTKTCKTEDEAYELYKEILRSLGLKNLNVL